MGGKGRVNSFRDVCAKAGRPGFSEYVTWMPTQRTKVCSFVLGFAPQLLESAVLPMFVITKVKARNDAGDIALPLFDCLTFQNLVGTEKEK